MSSLNFGMHKHQHNIISVSMDGKDKWSDPHVSCYFEYVPDISKPGFLPILKLVAYPDDTPDTDFMKSELLKQIRHKQFLVQLHPQQEPKVLDEVLGNVILPS